MSYYLHRPMHTSAGSKTKILIFIVAYNAENHITNVLDRIPENIYNDYDYEILIIDDHSKDKTYEIANKYSSERPNLNIKVLYNPINQGYGGNQKLGYRYAIINNFDQVVLLHGDGQYAPEELPRILAEYKDPKVSAVFGSRMINKKDARKGGMPLYKYIGNRILTTLQNKILNAKMTEFHSGYRSYSIHALKKIPFERNSNDFHFDTQIIIQLLISNRLIKEIPIPTFYGDEICHVNGVQYAYNIIKASIQSKLHAMNIFYKIEYDIPSEDSFYGLKLGYTSSHTMAIDAVKPGSKVLDIGCGSGLVAAELKKKDCNITGIDNFNLEDTSIFENYYKENLDFPIFDFPMEDFDTLIMLDIIEHIGDPEALMDFLRFKMVMNQPKIIMTTPNIAFIIMRLQLLFGNFNYGKKGILDKTHKRLFTFSSMERFIDQTGYIITKTAGIPAPFAEAIGDNWMSSLLLNINKVLIKISKRFFSYQIYLEIKPTPMVDHLLDLSIRTKKNVSAQLETTLKT